MRIEIRQLTKCYRGGKYALRDVDLEIDSGMFGLLGPNGAGKTTLMRILVTLLKPSSGQVLIDGLDLARDRARIRRLIGYLPQDFGRFPKLATWTTWPPSAVCVPEPFAASASTACWSRWGSSRRVTAWPAGCRGA